MSAADLFLYEPNRRPTVEIIADDNGDIAMRGDVVELVGWGDGNPRAQIVSERGNGLGQIITDPQETAPHKSGWGNEDYSQYEAGDFVGFATMTAAHAGVEWMHPSEGANLSVGTPVVYDAGGTVVGYDSAGDGAADTGDMIVGQVWSTVAREFGHAGKVAIYRFR